MARRKDLPCFRVSVTLERLEDRIMPRGRVPVLFRAEDPSLAPYTEQLAAFKAEKGVGPHDTLQVVFAFDA
jgi:hypothetical protein